MCKMTPNNALLFRKLLERRGGCSVVVTEIAQEVFDHVRGGASAVIWTDVVQMFVYIAGAGLVFYALLPIIRNTVTGILGVDLNVRAKQPWPWA